VRGLQALVFLGVSMMTPSALAQQPIQVEPDNDFAEPTYVFKPRGLRLNDEHKKVEITIRADIGREGKAENADFAIADEHRYVLAAIRRALPKWRFLPATKSCAPVASRQVFRLWIEQGDFDVKLSISSPGDERKKFQKQRREQTGEGAGAINNATTQVQPAAPIVYPKIQFAKHPDALFPYSARAAGVEGRVEYMVTVKSSGEAINGVVWVSTPWAEFGENVARAMQSTTFRPWEVPPGGRDAVCVVVPFKFCFSDNGEPPYPEPLCKRG
jgi:TonB family protein